MSKRRRKCLSWLPWKVCLSVEEQDRSIENAEPSHRSAKCSRSRWPTGSGSSVRMSSFHLNPVCGIGKTFRKVNNFSHLGAKVRLEGRGFESHPMLELIPAPGSFKNWKKKENISSQMGHTKTIIKNFSHLKYSNIHWILLLRTLLAIGTATTTLAKSGGMQYVQSQKSFFVVKIMLGLNW